MSTDNLNKLFEDLKDNFDVEEPNSDHTKRFLSKLNNKTNIASNNKTNVRNLWKPLLSIAASIILIVSLFITVNQKETVRDLANVSPEMAQTQTFFTSAISEELKKLESESNPETKMIINDALIQIKKLEINYDTLKVDLTKSGDDNRVIYAMIKNFQNRIDILQNTLEHIENIKQLNKLSNENNKTL
ncbi:hypothetical protein [Xanthomarina spongicola]|uniref:DUF4179 domain-containing protein n=1 Tax=Xanthomarina spongicola TaxID=570520 RepID=A0A316DKX6_9FLAO|nr:hypothetical protein [Xanthomarina spongicola]PWK17373.1 hypothetical protein LX78_02705 [Xanthomarina spongicola]